jgi:hypothetical protein
VLVRPSRSRWLKAASVFVLLIAVAGVGATAAGATSTGTLSKSGYTMSGSGNPASPAIDFFAPNQIGQAAQVILTSDTPVAMGEGFAHGPDTNVEGVCGDSNSYGEGQIMECGIYGGRPFTLASTEGPDHIVVICANQGVVGQQNTGISCPLDFRVKTGAGDDDIETLSHSEEAIFDIDCGAGNDTVTNLRPHDTVHMNCENAPPGHYVADPIAPAPLPSPVPATGKPGDAGSHGKTSGKPVHYKVEVKAWIPFKHIVDPVNPLRMPFGPFLGAIAGAGAISCYPPFYARPATVVKSLFRGDTHHGYGGSYRVHYWIGFDWDGKKISKFREGGRYGASHRDAYFSWPKGSKKCIQEVTGHGGLTASKAGNHGFVISTRAKNPLVFPQRLAPPIDQTVDGIFTDDGGLHLSYQTDLFPSYGLEVTRAGVEQLEAITVNSACLTQGQVSGPKGAANLVKWLGHDTQTGQLDVTPAEQGVTASTDNPHC